ncbi:MAG: 2-(1,2-epoxy-1,2-dihydrophenyl)acetyl-CoA isomerase [Flavobacteriales bacterium]|nr:MAG: 2-(1,2-epoxy-1,2-dihydrophenyl)acetyl-CoA isomerase [Flavobacteriales bacterium]
MPYQFIKFEIENAIGKITLNRPDVLNSFTMPMGKEMQEALDNCANDKSIRAVYLTGEGRAFCAGQDLEEAIAPDSEISKIVRTTYNPIIRKIRAIEKPVICAVNGVAAGAGANIAFACDITFAADSANFIQSFSNLGLIPDSAGTYFLPRLVGMQRAAALTMLAEKISAKKAEEFGLIWRAVPAEQLHEEAFAVAAKLAKMPTKGLGLTKRGFNQGLCNDLESQLDFEDQLQAEAGSSYDYREGVNAFLEKRKPEFKGE